MGHDLSIIGRHKLDTSTPEKLALNLSKRLKVKVVYYIQLWNEELPNPYGFGDIEYLHQFTVGEEYEKTFTLTADINHASKFNIETYYEDKPNFSLGVYDNEADRIFDIGLDSMQVRCQTNCRWYQWVGWIVDPDDEITNGETYRDLIAKQRKLIYDALSLYGGHEVFIFSDQQDYGHFSDYINTMTFDQITAKFKETLGDKIRYIPKE